MCYFMTIVITFDPSNYFVLYNHCHYVLLFDYHPYLLLFDLCNYFILFNHRHYILLFNQHHYILFSDHCHYMVLFNISYYSHISGILSTNYSQIISYSNMYGFTILYIKLILVCMNPGSICRYFGEMGNASTFLMIIVYFY